MKLASRKLTWVAALLLIAIPAIAEDHATDAEAKSILEASGARQGLCVHLGCGRTDTPGLIAALAGNSGYLVHGIALDDAALERARKAIEEKGLAGRASAERVPIHPLPYLNDLARLVVVEDLAALSAQGLTKDEILRVTSPCGTLLIREDGKWVKTVKPRPKEMDDWTHPQYGPDGNQVSADSALKLPIAMRWQDGLPVNLEGFAAERAWVSAGGRLFTVGINEVENLAVAPSEAAKQHGYPQYLTARDAFSGIPLWKLALGFVEEGGAGNWQNAAPLAAIGERVYAGGKDRVFIADASSGAVIAECPTKFQPTRLLVLDNILITANWEARARRDGDWLWQPKPSANAGGGTLDAFDAATGKALWSAQVLAFKILAADGVVYVQTQPAEAKTPGEIVALELKSGKERWRVSAEKLGNPAAMHLGSAGPGFATVFKSKELLTTVLSAADGSVRFEVPGKSDWTPLVNGFLWIANKRYDPLTGTKKGEAGTWLGGNACRQQALTPCFVISNYGMRGYSNPDQKPAAKPESSGLQGTRSACIIGWLPANGMIYSAQTACKCRPGAAYGFVGLGSGDSPPAAADFEQPRLVEKGPAFGTLAEAAPVDTADWPVFRHDALRSASTTARIPQDLKELWRTPVTKPGEDVLTGAWRSLLLSCVSAPVIQGGNVFVSTSDQGQVVALDASTGKPVWTATLGSRLNGPPALYRGLCVIGCNDGWVYALSTRDGRPVWRTRIAPQERRIVAFGRVESVWPAAGPVLIHEDTIFATAGRSSESEGGVALAALNPATGAVLWAKEIGPGPQRMNDALAVRDGLVAWQYLSFDPKKGDRVAPEKFPNDKDYDGGIARLQGSMIEPMWTVIKHRRAGNAYKLGGLFASQLAWNEKLAVGTGGGILREKLQGDAAPKPADFAWTFSHKPREQQIEALVLSADTVLCAGRNLNAKGGKPSGFFWIVSATDGKKTAEFPLECPPACDGIAVAGERVYLTLLNGQVLCFGK